MSDLTAFFFAIIGQQKVVDLDYTANWGRGNPSSYIDNVTFPKVLDTKSFKYRVIKGTTDLGVDAGFTVTSTGGNRVYSVLLKKLGPLQSTPMRAVLQRVASASVTGNSNRLSIWTNTEWTRSQLTMR